MAWIALLGSAMSLGMRMKERRMSRGIAKGVFYSVMLHAWRLAFGRRLPNKILFVVGIVRGHLADILPLG
jgi:hypothetical protein